MTYSSGEECRVATMPIGDQGKHVTAILRLTGFEEVPTEPSGSVQLSAIFSDSRHPADVQFLFPRGRELWASSDILSRSSPYFNAIFNSTLVSKVKSHNADTSSPSHTTPVDFEDSDDDLQELQDHTKVTAATSYKPPCDIPHYQIKVTSASYKTYRAVLCWIAIRHIKFAPIKSSSTPLVPNQDYSRSPAPVFPMSVFCLAHFLQIPELEQMVLQHFEPQVTVNNVAYELFGDVAGKHKEVRDIGMRFAAKNWAAVKGSSAFSKMKTEPREGERLTIYSNTLADLASMLS